VCRFHSMCAAHKHAEKPRLSPAARRAIAGPFVNFCAAQCDRLTKGAHCMRQTFKGINYERLCVSRKS